MSLFGTPQEHAANPPETWEVHKVSRGVWCLTAAEVVIDQYATKSAAEQAKVTGRWVSHYEKERRWYAGETVTGWRPYAEVSGA